MCLCVCVCAVQASGGDENIWFRLFLLIRIPYEKPKYLSFFGVSDTSVALNYDMINVGGYDDVSLSYYLLSALNNYDLARANADIIPLCDEPTSARAPCASNTLLFRRLAFKRQSNSITLCEPKIINSTADEYQYGDQLINFMYRKSK